jgi:hypothetical protein
MLILSIKNGVNKEIVPLARRWDRSYSALHNPCVVSRDIGALRDEEITVRESRK